MNAANNLVLINVVLADSISVSVKKDYLGSSTVQVSGGDVRSLIVRLIGWQIYAFGMYICRDVGRHTRSVDRYTRIVGQRVRTVGKRLPPGHSIGGCLVERIK